MSYLDERREHINKGRPLPEKKKPKWLKPVSDKRAAKIAAAKEVRGDESELDKFFEAMRKRMRGHCLFCNRKTEKGNDETFRNSIAHLLPKREIKSGGFPSVGTHEDNWIELCFWGEGSCHTNFDNGKITWEFLKDSKEWEVIREKLLNVLPVVAQEERKIKLYSKIEKLVYS